MARAGTFDPEMTTLGMFSDMLYAGGWADADFIPPPGGATLVGSFTLAVHPTITFSGAATLLGGFTLPAHPTATFSGSTTFLGSLTLPAHPTITFSSSATLLGSFTLSTSNTIRFDIPVTASTLDLPIRIGYEPMTSTIQMGGDS